MLDVGFCFVLFGCSMKRRERRLAMLKREREREREREKNRKRDVIDAFEKVERKGKKKLLTFVR